MHVIVWEFIVPEGQRRDFEAAYGPDGDWARLFGKAEGHRSTSLLHDQVTAGRYLTVDRWDSVEHFEAFRVRFAGDYEDLDRRLVGLADHETKLGDFETAI